MKKETTIFLAEIRAFMQRHDMAAATFGREALGNSSFVSRFEKGEFSPTLTTVDRTRAWMNKKDRELIYANRNRHNR